MKISGIISVQISFQCNKNEFHFMGILQQQENYFIN